VIDRECTRRTLAAGDYMVVEQCSCGAVHVTIGAVTMRLTASALPALAQTLDEAARSIVFRDAFTRLGAATELS
jgi:hypothetical protein